MTPKEIGQLIKRRRLERRKTQMDLARICGISQSRISKIESGDTDLNVVDAEKILRTLGIAVDAIFRSKKGR
jgi:transcriptional regulator with XRE-family HTH domain